MKKNHSMVASSKGSIQSDTLQIENNHLLEIFAFNVIGSPVTTGPPDIALLTPSNSESFSRNELNNGYVIGYVDNINTEISVNGNSVDHDGHYFWINFSRLHLRQMDEKIITVVAFDENGRQSTQEIEVFMSGDDAKLMSDLGTKWCEDKVSHPDCEALAAIIKKLKIDRM